MAVSPIFQSSPSLYINFQRSKHLDSRIDFVRESIATYINRGGLVVSATSNQPRFDHHPITSICNGLLVEESRTNLITYSAQFDNAAWTKVNSSVLSNQTISPDGTLSADKISANTTNNLHYIYHSASLTIGYPYTFSVYAKAAEYSWISLNLTPTHSQSGNYFDLSNGVIGTVAPGYTAEIISMNNGWYRCSVTYKGSTLSLRPQIEISNSNKGRIFSSANTSDGIYIWGCQVEQGEFSTSYIPTTTSSVTRNAEQVTLSGTKLNTWYNQEEGTLIGNFKKISSNVSLGYEISATDTTDKLMIEQNSLSNVVSNIVDQYGNKKINTLNNNVSTIIADYSTNIYDIINDEISSSGGSSQQYGGKRIQDNNYTIGLAYSPQDSFSCYNGQPGVLETTKEITSNMSKLNFGKTSSSTIGSGWLNWITYYPNRLTDTQVINLTR